MTPNVHSTKAKINKWDHIKLKTFCTAKEILNKKKSQLTEYKKIFANHIPTQRLISKIYKEHIQGSWVAQSVKKPTLDFSSGHNLVHGIKSHIRLCADSVESDWDSLSPSLSAPPLLTLSPLK